MRLGKKKAKSTAPPSKTESGAPKIVQGLTSRPPDHHGENREIRGEPIGGVVCKIEQTNISGPSSIHLLSIVCVQ
jgi:hypothetical protein